MPPQLSQFFVKIGYVLGSLLSNGTDPSSSSTSPATVNVEAKRPTPMSHEKASRTPEETIYFDIPSSPQISSRSPSLNPGATSLSSIDEGNGKREFTLLSLPVEIRLQIYDWLLVSRYSAQERVRYSTRRVVRDSTHRMVRLTVACQYRPSSRSEAEKLDLLEAQSGPIHPALLRTCKQIYNEALPILYSKNTFNFSEPLAMTVFTDQISTNIKHIRSLDIFVQRTDVREDWTSVIPWIILFQILANKAKGLRFISLVWHADIGSSAPDSWGLRICLGNSLPFVKSLSKIQGLQKLRISGYYAKAWPAFLEERMAVEVEAQCGLFSFENGVRFGQEEIVGHELVAREMEKFEAYQKWVESLTSPRI